MWIIVQAKEMCAASIPFESAMRLATHVRLSIRKLQGDLRHGSIITRSINNSSSSINSSFFGSTLNLFYNLFNSVRKPLFYHVLFAVQFYWFTNKLVYNTNHVTCKFAVSSRCFGSFAVVTLGILVVFLILRQLCCLNMKESSANELKVKPQVALGIL